MRFFLMEPIRIYLPGQPRGKAKKFTTRGGFVRGFNDAKTQAYMNDLGWWAKIAMTGRKPLEGPVAVVLTANMQIPASWRRKKRLAAVRDEIMPTGRPDLDNLMKQLDALKRIVWRDDAQIVRAYLSKKYAAEPGLEIEITPVNCGSS